MHPYRRLGEVVLCLLLTASGATESCHYAVAGESASRVWLGALQRATGEPIKSPHTPDLSFKQRYQYRLTLSRLDATLFEARWTEWRVEGELPAELQSLLHQIRQLSPVYYRRTASGALEFFCPTETAAWQRQAIASILYPFQMVRPDPQRTEWLAEEAHPSGRIVCRYRLVRTDKDGVQVINKAVAEVRLSPEERQMGKTHQILGHLQYRVDSRGVILAVSGELRERVGLNGLPASHTDVKLDIRLERRVLLKLREVEAKRAQLARLQGTWQSLYAPPTETEQELARAQAHLRNTTQAQLLQELDALLTRIERGESVPPEEQTALRLKLDAGLIVFGAPFLAELTQRLRTRPREDDGFWLLLGVLSQSRTPNAQSALVDAFEQIELPSLRRALAQQFSFISHPHPETVQRLWRRARELPAGELQQILTMSVSNLTRLLRESAPELHRAVGEWSRAQLQAAQDEPTIRFWLTVLGALGDSAAFPLIEQHARRGEELTRLSAIEALSSQLPKDAILLLQRLYPNEPSVAVREKMVQLLPNWWAESAARALMERAVFSDAALQVRRACVQALATLAAHHEDALRLLVKVAETNSEPSIRREAMVALATLHAAGVKVPPVKAAP